MHAETPTELLHEVEAGKSEKTPFIALGGVTIVVALAVIAVCAVVFIAYFLA